jgi:glycosyltransferase involved in cell wall biosynthesis
MRILLGHSRYRVAGGEESYVERIAPALERAGHAVALYAVATPVEPGAPRRLALFADMLWSIRAARAVASIARRFRPDVLHVHNLYPNLSPSVLTAARGGGAAIVMHMHNARLVCPAGTLFAHGQPCRRCVDVRPRVIAMWPSLRHNCRGSLVEGAAYAGALTLHRALGAFDAVEAFIATSAFLRTVLVDGGLPPDRVHTLPNFIDPPAAPPSPPPATELPSSPYVVYAGRLSAEKGLAVLLSAMAGVTSFRLLVAGDGPLLVEGRARAATGRLPVEFLGRLERPQLASLLAGARCAVLPSLAQETTPFSALEALAAGAPVVASAVGGLPDLVGGAGLLVPPGAPAPLRAALERVVADDDLRRALGAHAAARVRAHHLDEHLRRLEKVYATAVAARRQQRR